MGKPPDRMLRIVIDTREQRPFVFSAAKYPADTTRATLKTGDYSLAGLEDAVAIERKSLDDLIGCLTVGRDRFERELARGRSLACFAVVVEANMEDVARHRYRSKMDPHAVLQSILAFQVRYSVPFVWAGNRSGAEYAVFWTLEKFRRDHGEAALEAQAVAEMEALGRRRKGGRIKEKRTPTPNGM